MSLFKTLQHSPATISIFHNSDIKLSSKLYNILDKAYYKLNENDAKFQVDLMSKKMPTYDQYQSILSNANASSKRLLQQCYPFLNDKSKEGSQLNVTIKGLSLNGLKVFSEGEYSMIYDAFNRFVEENEDANAEDIFRAPLIVDWDQNSIANDEDGLHEILRKYKN